MKPADLFKKIRGVQTLEQGTQFNNSGGNDFLYTGAGPHLFRILPKPVTDSDPITPEFIGIMSVVDTPLAGRTVTLDLSLDTLPANLDGSSTIISNAGPGQLTVTTSTGPFNPPIVLLPGQGMEFIAGVNLDKPAWVAINFGGTVPQGGGTVAQQKGAVTLAGKIGPTDIDNFKLPDGVAGNSGYDLVFIQHDLNAPTPDPNKPVSPLDPAYDANVMVWPNGVAADDHAGQWRDVPLVDYSLLLMMLQGYEKKKDYTHYDLWSVLGSVKGTPQTDITAMCVMSESGRVTAATTNAARTQGALWESLDFGRTWEPLTINIKSEGWQPAKPTPDNPNPKQYDKEDVLFTGAVESIVLGNGNKRILSMNYTAIPGQEKAFVYVENLSFGFWNEEGIDENTKHNYDTLTAMGGKVLMVAASPDCTVMRSTNNGDDWKTYVKQLEGAASADLEEVTRMVHAGAGQLLAAVNPGGLLHTVDADAKDTIVFRADSVGANYIYDILDFGGDVVLLALGASDTTPGDNGITGNIVRSTDNGRTWGDPVTSWAGVKSTGRFIDFGGGVVAIAVENINQGSAASYSTYATWVSEDYGQTWRDATKKNGDGTNATPGVSKITARLSNGTCLVYYPGKGLYREAKP